MSYINQNQINEFLESFIGHSVPALVGYRERLWFFCYCITFNALRMGARGYRCTCHIK